MVQSQVRQSYPWWNFLWLTFHDNLNIFSFGGARNEISNFPIPMASTSAFGHALQVKNSLCVEVPERLSLLSSFARYWCSIEPVTICWIILRTCLDTPLKLAVRGLELERTARSNPHDVIVVAAMTMTMTHSEKMLQRKQSDTCPTGMNDGAMTPEKNSVNLL